MKRLWHQLFGCPQWATETYSARVGTKSAVTLYSCRLCGRTWWGWLERWAHDLLKPMDADLPAYMGREAPEVK